ncbi:NUDIX domain-containing protein [Marinilactibacillus kalidii]|uniref:NUDIX domain-containing protein n=1 Tax=Marinilactibacillus kalidii TaxID=2820274 RepID=UPI001FC90648|nr:NUDIX domain-containing protein [Marinilactibacillus kalidii]
MVSAVKGLILKDNQFLAVHKASESDSKFELPGGRMIFGETMEETLIREVKEEVNLTIRPTQLIDTWHLMNPQEEWQISGVIYATEVLTTAQMIILSEEHDQYAWLDIDELEKMTDSFYSKMKQWDWEKLLKSH